MDTPKPETVFRTPNPDCPACRIKLRHTVDEWRQFHVEAGTGGRKGERTEPQVAKAVGN